MNLFIKSIFYSILALIISFVVVPGSPQSFAMIAIFIVAFYGYEQILFFLQENKENIIDKKINPQQANIHTFKQIFIIFLAIALVFGLFFYFFYSDYIVTAFQDLLIRKEYFEVTNLQIAPLKFIMLNNIFFLLISAIFAIFFSNYALGLFITLGSVYTGLGIGYLFCFSGNFAYYLFNLIFIILPKSWLIFSSIILSVGIYFLMKGLSKYQFKKDKTMQDIQIMKSIYKTVIIIALIAIFFNILSSLWEGVILKALLINL